MQSDVRIFAREDKYAVLQLRRIVMPDAYPHRTALRAVGMARAAELLLVGRTCGEWSPGGRARSACGGPASAACRRSAPLITPHRRAGARAPRELRRETRRHPSERRSRGSTSHRSRPPPRGGPRPAGHVPGPWTASPRGCCWGRGWHRRSLRLKPGRSPGARGYAGPPARTARCPGSFAHPLLHSAQERLQLLVGRDHAHQGVAVFHLSIPSSPRPPATIPARAAAMRVTITIRRRRAASW